MSGTSGTVIEGLAVGVPSVILAGASFFYGNRAHREEAEADEAQVDAGAYDRARALYESVIATTRQESADLRAEILRLRAEVDALRDEVAGLEQVNRRLQAQISSLGVKPAAGLPRPPET